MAPGTEFTRDFCARIGLLQLGVVLVFFINLKNFKKHNDTNFAITSVFKVICVQPQVWQ